MSVATSHKAVIEAVVARLIDQISVFNAKTMFLADSADAASSQPKKDKIWGCVIPMQGTPDDREFEGSGPAGLLERTGVTVIVFSNKRLDQAGESAIYMTDASSGLLELKRQVLKALCDWIPVDGSDNQLLVNAVQPLHCDPPQKSTGDKVGDLAITFSTDFEWDLS